MGLLEGYEDAYCSPNEMRVRSGTAGRWNLRIACLLAGTLLAIGVLYVYIAEPFEPYWIRERVGPIKAIGNDNELWFFIEMERLIHLPGKITSNPTRKYGHYQIVVVMDRQNVKRRIVVPRATTSPSFHPNQGDIFRLNKTFFLFEGQSSDNTEAMYEWQTNRFTKLPPKTAREKINNLNLHNFNNPLDDDELPNENGWNRLINLYDLLARQERFTWRDSSIQICVNETDHVADVQVQCQSDAGNWSASLIKYDPRSKRKD